MAAHLARADDLSLRSLRLLSVNCGGIRGKAGQLVSLLVKTDPDVVFLQEAGKTLKRNHAWRSLGSEGRGEIERACP